jgi:twitching motility protein PilT
VESTFPNTIAQSPQAQALAAAFAAAVSAGCSDIHMRAGSPPFGRRDGQLVRMNGPAMTAADMEMAIRLTAQRELPASSSFEYSFEQGGAVRFRCHAFRDTDGWALAVRVVPRAVPSFNELRLPPVLKTFALARPGLTLITGPMGSGKSTTAASVLHTMALTQPLHIVTLEDPIEYLLTDTPSCVNQRELGRDAPDGREALRDALRQDPDVLFLGEMRDPQDLEIALHSAEMGVAVYSTFHAHGAAATFNRLVAMHAPEVQATARDRLTDALRGIISQRLLPRRGGTGRVLATEVMVNTYTIKECLRDPQRTKTLPQVIERATDQGMHTFDQSLIQLCSAGIIDVDVASGIATSPGNLRRALNLAGMSAA